MGNNHEHINPPDLDKPASDPGFDNVRDAAGLGDQPDNQKDRKKVRKILKKIGKGLGTAIQVLIPSSRIARAAAAIGTSFGSSGGAYATGLDIEYAILIGAGVLIMWITGDTETVKKFVDIFDSKNKNNCK